jgi:hypothetical protein
MIKLKNEINKSAMLRELRKEAEQRYKDSWQPELQVEAFMKGAETLFNLLRLPRVIHLACAREQHCSMNCPKKLDDCYEFEPL